MTRSIPELIGWHRLEDPYGELDDVWTRDGRGWDYCDRHGDDYTADDLLAWLMAERGLIPVIKSHVGGWLVSLADNDLRLAYKSPMPSHHATLLEALEQAVRAVAGES